MRFVLGLPVYLIAVPLLVYLLQSPPPSPESPPVTEFAPPEVAPVKTLPTDAGMERLAATDPIAFLENCLRRYYQQVKGYHLLMQKQERLAGKLHPMEIVDVFFREHPYSVLLIWKQGSWNAERVLYVDDENNPKKVLLARPNSELKRRLVGDITEQGVRDPLARQSGRFPVDEFGLRKATERYLASWEAARAKNQLDVRLVGIHPLPEANGQPVYHFHRRCAVPENDGVMEQTLYIDKATWLQVGSVIRGEGGTLIGEYYFRDIQVNPEFKPDQFTRQTLIPH